VIRAVVRDVLNEVPPAAVSARFHNTLVAATAEVARAAARALAGPGASRPRVVLTGGCFQNARLAEGIIGALGADHDVYVHRRVPPGDGGIALGQALIAAERAAHGVLEREAESREAKDLSRQTPSHVARNLCV
jgi:hydrogenase maturation protein HypF